MSSTFSSSILAAGDDGAYFGIVGKHRTEGCGVGGGVVIRLSDVGIPALRTSVADVLRISLALVQSSLVLCQISTR